MADPITREVVRNRLESILREMARTMEKTARSSTIYSGHDFSCGLFDDESSLLAMGTKTAVHIFPIYAQLKFTVDKFKGDINAGDIFILNDPYFGGSHLPDVMVAMPFFYKDELVAYVATRAHWSDVGGMSPGSISGNATTIYQEGLRIPPLKLSDRGKMNEAVRDLIMYNMRLPEARYGDLMAGIAANGVGARELGRLCDRYGKGTVRECFRELLGLTEKRIRALIRKLPKGTFIHEDYLDNDGVTLDAKKIRVAVTIGEDDITVDYTGTSPQSQGPINVSDALGRCFAAIAIKASIDPYGPLNQGFFRVLTVISPLGTMLNACPPAATGGMTEVGAASLIGIGALAQAVPKKVCAQDSSASNHQFFGGTYRKSLSHTGLFVYYEYPAPGNGATYINDGASGTRTIRSGNVDVMSLEFLESQEPVVFKRFELRKDSGGAGKRRGGLGLIRDYECSVDGHFSLVSDHAKVPLFGLFGAEPGSTCRWTVIDKGGRERPISVFESKVTNLPVKAQEVIGVRTQGGGGYGDPLEREPELVWNDVLDEYVSLEEARNIYGVIIDPLTDEIDAKATEEQRTKLKDQRLFLKAEQAGEPCYDKGLRVAYVSDKLLHEGFTNGDLAEIIKSDHPTPMRVSVQMKPELNPDRILVDKELWSLLGFSPSCNLVRLRRLRGPLY